MATLKGLHFPDSFTAVSDHVTKTLPMGYEQKYCVQLWASVL